MTEDIDDANYILSYDPTIFDLHRYCENFIKDNKYTPIVGNFEARIAMPLVFALRGVSVVLKGASGSGKSTIIKCSAQMIFGDDVFKNKVPEVFYMAGSSKKGFITDSLMDRIANVCTHCIIPELQNAIAENQIVEAMIKLWTEGEAYVYSRADYGGRISREIILKPLPIMTSIATENKYSELGEEMERRFLPFYTVSSAKLNEEIHKKKAEKWSRFDEDLMTMTENEKLDLRLHFRDIMSQNFKVKNPCAEFMQRLIPKNFVISNSQIEYWLEMVAAMTEFNYKNRIIIESPKRKEKYLISTPSDNWLAWILGGSAVVLASMNIPDMGREIIDILPKRTPNNLDAGISINELIDELSGKGIERTKKQIQQILKSLEAVSYAKRDEHNREIYYRTQDYDFDTSVDWKSCIEEAKRFVKEKIPNIAKDYISNYCDKAIEINPFTGEKIDLHELEYNNIEESEKTKRRLQTIDLSQF